MTAKSPRFQFTFETPREARLVAAALMSFASAEFERAQKLKDKAREMRTVSSPVFQEQADAAEMESKHALIDRAEMLAVMKRVDIAGKDAGPSGKRPISDEDVKFYMETVKEPSYIRALEGLIDMLHRGGNVCMVCLTADHKPGCPRLQSYHCTCHFECGQDSASGHWHQHEDEPCPVHPDAEVIG